jgi:hypothetical protein
VFAKVFLKSKKNVFPETEIYPVHSKMSHYQFIMNIIELESKTWIMGSTPTPKTSQTDLKGHEGTK